MKIKEVSAITGLSKKTIRFYEEAGLIAPPKRKLNGREFRDYTEEELAKLTEIVVLRKARFTIEEILNMQNGTLPVQEIFSEYYLRIKREQREMQQLVSVLDAISDRSFDTRTELVREISDVTEEMNLPRGDIHPNFRQIDALEERLGLKTSNAKTKKKKQSFKQTAAMTQASTLAQYQTKPGVRDGSMSGSSVLLTMRMLDDEK